MQLTTKLGKNLANAIREEQTVDVSFWTDFNTKVKIESRTRGKTRLSNYYMFHLDYKDGQIIMEDIILKATDKGMGLAIILSLTGKEFYLPYSKQSEITDYEEVSWER